MPNYTYNGTIPFVHTDYGLWLEPGETFDTEYVLPSDWPDFTLNSASDTNDIITNTMRPILTPGGNVSINVEDYAFLSIAKGAGDGLIRINMISDSVVVNTIADIGDTLNAINFEMRNYPRVDTVQLEGLSSNPGSVEAIVIRSQDEIRPYYSSDSSGGGGGGTTIGGTDNMRTRLDYQGGNNVIYAGYAQPGSSESDPVWQIRRMTYDANDNLTNVDFADGTASFDKIWNNRTGYTYG